MRLLLLSNSTNFGGTFLGHATGALSAFLRGTIEDAVFIPFAAVRFGFDDFASMVAGAFAPLGCRVRSVHSEEDWSAAVRSAGAVIVGGGNTFQLLEVLHRTGIASAIRESVRTGTPYIGWSAGANIACPTIRTTNDMPIVEPHTFEALGLVPFQINPHFTAERLPDHGGETRVDRLHEFTTANPEMPVVALPEGTMLEVDGERTVLIGHRPALLFRHGQDPVELPTGPISLL